MVNTKEQFEVSVEVKDLLEVMSEVNRAYDKFIQYEKKYKNGAFNNTYDVMSSFSDLQEELSMKLNELLCK